MITVRVQMGFDAGRKTKRKIHQMNSRYFQIESCCGVNGSEQLKKNTNRSSPLRIAFLDSWLTQSAEGSGTAVSIRGLARALSRMGHKVDRITPYSAWPLNLVVRRLWFNIKLAKNLIGSSLDNPGYLLNTEYDLIVGFDIDGFLIADLNTTQYVCSIKGVLAEEANCESGLTRLLLWCLSKLEQRNAIRAMSVIATSQYCCDRIQRHYGVPSDRLKVVPEGIDLDFWQPDLIGAQLAWDELIRHDEERDPYTVLCVARQYPRKRITDLISAFSKVLSALPMAKLVVVGDGPEHQALCRQVNALKIESSVRMVGAVADDADVRAWFQRCSIFCLPSIQEGFGIVFLEAMASGLPIVACNCTAVSEVVPHGRAGVLVQPRDPDTLAATIIELLRDKARIAEYRAFGRNHVRQFSWEAVAKEFLAAVNVSRDRAVYRE